MERLSLKEYERDVLRLSCIRDFKEIRLRVRGRCVKSAPSLAARLLSGPHCDPVPNYGRE